jgi:hypothetical protein
VRGHCSEGRLRRDATAEEPTIACREYVIL